MPRSTSNVSAPADPADPSARHRSRITLLLIFAVAVAPFVLAWLAYLFWEPGRFMNHGELIAPRQLPSGALTLRDGRPFRLDEHRGKWVMIHVDSGACGESCRKQLYYMRQVRLALGADRDRIARVWLLTDDRPPSAEIAALYDGVDLVRAAGSPLVAALPAERDPSDHVYLVDPLGNRLLRFPRDPDPKRMLKDLQRLLKVSRIG
jgi:cytochrome oxidase Cu insertion factor (SCO1/SenC/PrrC family)